MKANNGGGGSGREKIFCVLISMLYDVIMNGSVNHMNHGSSMSKL